MMDRLAWMGTGWREVGFGIGSDSKKVPHSQLTANSYLL